MEAFGVYLIGGVVFVAIAVAINQASYHSAARKLRAFADRLEGGSVRRDRGWPPGLSDTEVTGDFEGRPIRVTFRVEGVGKHKRTYVEHRMRVEKPGAPFQLTKANLGSRVGRWLGLVEDVPTGNARVDQEFIVSGAQDELTTLFQGSDMERALWHLCMERLATKVSLSRTGELMAEAEMRELSPYWLERTFQALGRVAALCDRREVEVRVLGERPHFAWTGGSDEVRCPYCRDAVDLAADGLAACDACQTVHHAPCLAEAGGCTIFGCRGGRPPGSGRPRA